MAAIATPPMANDIAAVDIGATPMPEQYATAITTAMPTSSTAHFFSRQAKWSVSDYKILQKVTQWTSWHQSMVIMGWDHSVTNISSC